MGIIVLLVAIVTGLAYECAGQEVIIVKKDGSKLSGKVVATSATSLFIKGASVILTDIASVDIQETGKSADDLNAYLSKANISVTSMQFSKTDYVQSTIASPVAVKEYNEIDLRLEKFALQRRNGKLLQVAGVFVMGASVGVQALYNQQYQDDYAAWITKPTGKAPTQKLVSPLVSFVGLGLGAVGFVIDIDAGRHIRLKR